MATAAKGKDSLLFVVLVYLFTRIFMNAQDWINVARCNQRRMMQDKIYTLFNTSQHDVFLAHWNTTNAALKLAQRASLNIA
jgi:hypothetical protein